MVRRVKVETNSLAMIKTNFILFVVVLVSSQRSAVSGQWSVVSSQWPPSSSRDHNNDGGNDE